MNLPVEQPATPPFVFPRFPTTRGRRYVVRVAELISHNPAETATLGEHWGRTVARGCVIALHGDLGAGKTQWVKGLARGLGITARVHSPTFTLVNVYPGGRLSLFHLDLYRLETPDQIHEAGLEEYLTPDGVTVIEWAERWPLLNPEPAPPTAAASRALRRVWIEIIGDTQRRIYHEDPGA